MAGRIEIDFREIRAHEGDKRKGFEGLVCQLARREKIRSGGEFRRVEGSGGDAGTEAYWILADGSEYGYQAKYFLASKAIDWAQVDDSVKTALEQHPRLTRYAIAIPCDFTDRSGKQGKGKKGWEHWTTHKCKWEEWAYSRGVTTEFVPWTKSDLIDRLVARSENHGLVLYWFNRKLFDKEWFSSCLGRSIADLGERYQPEDNVEVHLKRTFDGLARSPQYLSFLSNWFSDVPTAVELSSEVRKIDSLLDEGLLLKLQQLCAELNLIGESINNFFAQPFPIDEWKVAIKNTADAIAPIRDWLYSKESKCEDPKRQAVQRARKHLARLDYQLDTTPIHLGSNNPNDIRVEADLRRVLLVVGEAGSGKSHLFADTVNSFLSNSVPAILLLGQHFPGQDIRREFLNCLDLSSYDFQTVLQALNSAGEHAKTRLVILIDALNEAQSLRIWPDQLAGFITDILKYDWLSIGISLRPEYVAFLIPQSVRDNAAQAQCHGIMSEEEQEQAAVQYFEKRGIVRPAVPWLAPEFSNFLFLKTCCDALQELGIHQFPRGLHGALSVLTYYLDSVQSKIKKRFPDSEVPHIAVHKSIRRIAKLMSTAKTNYIPIQQAIDACESEFGSKGPSFSTNWFYAPKSEGVFRQDHIFCNRKQDPFEDMQVVYRFTYQRFSDSLIAQALLEEVSDIDKAFQAGGALCFLFEKKAFSFWHSLWTALALQVPERFPGKEILDLVPKNIGRVYEHTLFEAFEQSLIWRSASAFSDRTLQWFNTLPNHWYDPRLNILTRLATLEGHPWNAEFLDRNLRRRTLPERDAFWTVTLNKIDKDDRHPICELIRWCLKMHFISAETETLRLAAITLAWIFTSSNCPLRDSATKALVCIFLKEPQLIPSMIELFQRTDDLYVMERICAAILGAATRDIPGDHLKLSAQALYLAIFARETPHLNILLRDYARAVIEYAFLQRCLPEEVDIEKCRPPYRSDWPLNDTTEEELKRLAEEAGGNQIFWSATDDDFGVYEITPKVAHFTRVPLTQDRPLNEEEKREAFKGQIAGWDLSKRLAFSELEKAIDEKRSSLHIGTGASDNQPISFSYSEEAVGRVREREAEFLSSLSPPEREIYQTLMLPVVHPNDVPYEDRGLPNFDANFARRWVVNRAYSLGWNRKLFPDDHGKQELSRQRPKIERIGKKYQWLSLFELLARLSDNVWAVARWPELAMIYDHPATDWFVRDVEPSLLFDPIKSIDQKYWWQALPLIMEPIADESVRNWPLQGDPPNRPDWMNVSAPDGKPWLLLYGFFRTDERRAKDDIAFIAFRRSFFVRISTILVESASADSAIARLKGNRLADPSGHETIDWTDGPFLCEYPWRNTWETDYDIYEEGYRSLSGIRYIRPVARHVWEGHLDLSLKNGSSRCIPNPWLGKKLGLRANLERPGEFVTESDHEIVFVDPSVNDSGSSAALIDGARFSDFLEKEKLECIWIVAGELNSYPSGKHGDYACRSFASVYRRTGGKWVGERWHDDTTRSPSA